MKIESPAFLHNEKIPSKYTADGEDINPPLTISKIPQNTKFLLLIVDDPDAQKVCGYTWIHWVIFNIPVEKETIEIQENSIPGTEGKNSFNKTTYGGPSPPPKTGIHNYNFKIYALDKKLELPEMTPLSKITETMQNHLIANSILTAQYSRD